MDKYDFLDTRKATISLLSNYNALKQKYQFNYDTAQGQSGSRTELDKKANEGLSNLLEEVETALDGLTADERQFVEWRYITNTPNAIKRIQAVKGCEEKTAYNALSNAVGKLEKALYW